MISLSRLIAATRKCTLTLHARPWFFLFFCVFISLIAVSRCFLFHHTTWRWGLWLGTIREGQSLLLWISRG